MAAGSRGVEKWSSADSAAAWVPSCSWSSPPAPMIRPSSSRRRWTLRLPLVRAREASCSTRRSSWLRRPWSTATSPAYEAEATMSAGSSPGWRKTGTMIRATFVLPSRLGRSARPMFCTISTWEVRVSAKQTESTPPFAGDVHALSEHPAAGEERPVHARPAASMPPANWRSTSRRSVTRWSPHSHADQTRSGDVAAGLQLVEARADRRGGEPVPRPPGPRPRRRCRTARQRSAASSPRTRRPSTFWWNVMTVRRLYAAACSNSAVCSRARRRPRCASSDSPRTGRGRGSPARRSRTRRGCHARSPHSVRVRPATRRRSRPGRRPCSRSPARARRCPLRPGRGEDARGGGEVEPEAGRNAGVVMDRRPRPAKITRG